LLFSISADHQGESAMLCEEIMHTDKLETITLEDTVMKAADTMRRRNIGFLPVADPAGKVVGTVTDRDIAVRLVAEDMPARTKIRYVMTNEVIACRPDDDLNFAKDLMAQHQKSRIMCTDDDGQLAGIISLADLAQWGDGAADTLRQVTQRESRAA
jgi:CBS domain-containing protein